MKCLSESEALERLEKIKKSYRNEIQTRYEPKAKNCLTCEVQGSCCTDAHFVNVNITKLEAVAIIKNLQKIDGQKQTDIFRRIEKTVEKYDLKDTGDIFSQTFSCPLFEKGTGCLAHSVKPVSCIQHACYERREDLPPDELQTQAELKIERLNSQTYRRHFTQLPLPVWLNKLNPSKKSRETN